MMTPPVKPFFSRKVRTMPRRRERSSRDSILRETPMWSTVGMKTRKRPAMVTWQVMRAPLVPSGSFATWTMTSCPSRSRSSIFASLAAAALLPVLPFLLVFARLEAVELLDGVDDVGDVEEAVALEADVDERRLHPRQHLRHASLVDVADDAPLALALDEDLGHQVILENGHHRLVPVRGDNHFFVHEPPSVRSEPLSPEP